MHVDDILTRVRAEEELPENWVVFPLLRPKVIMAILGWISGIIIGGGLLALVTPIVIPGNYERSIVAAIVTTLILCTLAFIFVGSLVLLVLDIRRLSEIEKHLIVITDEDFVKQEGLKIIQVPLLHVRYVTARGRAPTANTPSADTKDRDTSLRQLPGMRDNMLGMFLGHGVTGTAKTRRARMRTPTSLAFIDARTEKEITVVNDEAYGDPFVIAAVLKEHAAGSAHRAGSAQGTG
jgi:hypothetical protein